MFRLLVILFVIKLYDHPVIFSFYNIVVLREIPIGEQLFSYLEADKTMIEGDMRPDPFTSGRQRRTVSSLARHKWPSNSIPYVFDETPGQSVSKPRVIVR